MLQLVINSELLREIDESKLLNYYAKLCYITNEDLTEDNKIQSNLKKLLDWDENGDLGLALYCSKFESLKRRDIEMLISFIKSNIREIKARSKESIKIRNLENKKIVLSNEEKSEELRKKHFTDEHYRPNPFGKKAKPTLYKGKWYKSRQECMYKEGITKNQLYKYLQQK